MAGSPGVSAWALLARRGPGLPRELLAGGLPVVAPPAALVRAAARALALGLLLLLLMPSLLLLEVLALVPLVLELRETLQCIRMYRSPGDKWVSYPCKGAAPPVVERERPNMQQNHQYASQRGLSAQKKNMHVIDDTIKIAGRH